MITLRPHQQTAVNAMQQNALGQIIVPTGGGKTLIAIMDAVKRFEVNVPRTIVVVCPRILLVEQLSAE
jgi:superfamily II DNA or RNA helicase